MVLCLDGHFRELLDAAGFNKESPLALGPFRDSLVFLISVDSVSLVWPRKLQELGAERDGLNKLDATERFIYICIHSYLSIYLSISLSLSRSIEICIYIYTYTYTYTYIYTHVE